MFPSRLGCWLLLTASCAVAQSAPSPQTVGEVYASDAKLEGSVVLTAAGASVLSGSAVAAGNASASLRLRRGGEVRICPRTAISVTSSPSGRDLMLSMSGGSIEPQYALPASADTIMTPDFRVLLAGPGNFHFALGVDEHGDTCVRTLQWNTASIIVSELIGDGLYQVKPNEDVLFRGGKIAGMTRNAGGCGCGGQAPPMKQALAAPPAAPLASAPAAPPPADDVQVQVDAPFIFRADEPPPIVDLTIPLMRLHAAAAPSLATHVLPPPPAAAAAQTAPAPVVKSRRGFFGKMRSVLAKLFR